MHRERQVVITLLVKCINTLQLACLRILSFILYSGLNGGQVTPPSVIVHFLLLPTIYETICPHRLHFFCLCLRLGEHLRQSCSRVLSANNNNNSVMYYGPVDLSRTKRHAEVQPNILDDDDELITISMHELTTCYSVSSHPFAYFLLS